MFFKKKQETPSLQEAQPAQIPKEPTQANSHNDKDNYGDADINEEFLNTAGKVGKAQHNYFRQLEAVKPNSEHRAVSKEELALHNTAASAWLSLNGTVYDVTNYIKFHPGGRLILQGCGKECADLFNKYHPWVNGQFLLKKYKLGYYVG